MKSAGMIALVAGLAMTTAGGLWGAVGWTLFVAALVALAIQQKVISKLQAELDYARNEMELLSNNAARLKADFDALDQRFLRDHTKMLEMSKNMERMLKEEAERDAKEKDRDEEVKALSFAVDSNLKTIERLTAIIEKYDLEKE